MRASRLAWLSLAFAAWTYMQFFILGPDRVVELAQEDDFYEMLTAVFFATASVLFMLSFLRGQKGDRAQYFFLVLALAFFFGAGEELSWGQRLLGYHTPTVLQGANVQNEFNVHNLEIFNRTDARGADKPRWALLLNFEFLFNCFWFFYCFVFPLLALYARAFGDFTQKIRLPLPPPTMGLAFMAYYLSTKAFELVTRGEWSYLQRPYVEVKECVFAFMFALIAWWFWPKRVSLSS